MAARRVTSVCLPVGARSVVEFRRYEARSPILTIRTGYPPVLVTLTLPERVEEGHVQFARQLARHAALYAWRWSGRGGAFPPWHHPATTAGTWLPMWPDQRGGPQLAPAGRPWFSPGS
jgi:hypothetical protein